MSRDQKNIFIYFWKSENFNFEIKNQVLTVKFGYDADKYKLEQTKKIPDQNLF